MDTYETVENRPCTCTFCGATVQGREVTNLPDRFTKEVVTECLWSCARCGRVIKRGIMSIKKDE